MINLFINKNYIIHKYRSDNIGTDIWLVNYNKKNSFRLEALLDGSYYFEIYELLSIVKVTYQGREVLELI
jgi:hypothetical protein